MSEPITTNDRCVVKGISWAIFGFLITFALVFMGWASFGLIVVSIADFKTAEQVITFNSIMNSTLFNILWGAFKLATFISSGLFCFGYIKEWTSIKLFEGKEAVCQSQ